MTPQERRIIARTQFEGEQEQKREPKRAPLWRSILMWVVGIAVFYLLGWFMLWVGSLLA